MVLCRLRLKFTTIYENRYATDDYAIRQTRARTYATRLVVVIIEGVTATWCDIITERVMSCRHCDTVMTFKTNKQINKPIFYRIYRVVYMRRDVQVVVEVDKSPRNTRLARDRFLRSLFASLVCLFVFFLLNISSSAIKVHVFYFDIPCSCGIWACV